MPFFLPRSRQGREAGRLGPASGGSLQGPTAAGDRGKMRRGRGDSIPVLTLSWGGAWEWIGDSGQREVAVLGAAARWSSGKGRELL
jgi:hypothetical protein